MLARAEQPLKALYPMVCMFVPSVTDVSFVFPLRKLLSIVVALLPNVTLSRFADVAMYVFVFVKSEFMVSRFTAEQ